MNVTKQQIIDGAIKYMRNEVIDKVTDKPLKIAMAMGVSMIETNSSVADKLFENDIISSILDKNEDGTYDIGKISEVIERTLNEYGDFPVKIPAIKFISPSEKELNFSSSDIRKLKAYIEGGSIV